MTTTHEEEVFISFCLNREGKFVKVQQGTRSHTKQREKPPTKIAPYLVKVATIEVYRDDSPGASTSETPSETPSTTTDAESERKKRPPCWCFVNPPGVWVCGCEPPNCPD